jgi:hypothetical protein
MLNHFVLMSEQVDIVRSSCTDSEAREFVSGYDALVKTAHKLLETWPPITTSGASTIKSYAQGLKTTLRTYKIAKAIIDNMFLTLAAYETDLHYVTYQDYGTHEKQHRYAEVIVQTLECDEVELPHPRHGKVERIMAAPAKIKQFANELRLYDCTLYD